MTEQETKRGEGEGEAQAEAEKVGGAEDEGRQDGGSNATGPTFTEGPNPLEGVSKGLNNLWNSMEGKTVSMRVYVGTILGVVVLMLLARCGG